jgi:hypothetical protein
MNHNHKAGRPARVIVGRPGVWVWFHQEWCRPLHVWLYRGAWRVVCRRCMTGLASELELYGNGWPTIGDAFDAALAHCAACPIAGAQLVEAAA